MKEKMKKIFSKVKTGCFLLPCFLVAGGVVFAGSEGTSATTTIELEAYDISKVEAVLKAQQKVKEENRDTTKSISVSGKAAAKKKVTGSHGEAQSFIDGTYEGEGVGFAGHIKVKVVVEGSKIVFIEVTEVEADDAPFVAKAKGVIDSMIQYQTMEVDTISGATYSSKGIIAAVRNALEGVVDDSEPAPQKGKPAPTELPEFEDSEYKDGIYYGTGTGFGGEVKVKVVISDGKMEEIAIESASGEDGSYLTRAKTLIEKVLEKQSPNVDTVSGATYTSNGIISAIQNALLKAGKSTDTTKTEHTVEVNLAEDSNLPAKARETIGYQDGTYTGTAKGFRGDMKATVKIEKGKISNIDITSKDDKAFLEKAITLVETIIKRQTTEGVDVVTGATYSSNGIINSVKAALEKATGSKESLKTEEDAIVMPTVKPVQEPTKTPEMEEDTEKTYIDGTYQGKGLGFNDYVHMEVVVENGSITKITVKSYEDDDEFFWNAYNGVTAQILEKQKADGIDVVTGATYSSEGIIDAVKNALEQAKE